jgi:hypothetical protein
VSERQKNPVSPVSGATGGLGAGPSAGKLPQAVPQVRGKRIVPAKVVEVKKEIYNAIRSFVESSPKPEYEWNTGVKLGSQIVYRKEKKWILTVYLEPTPGSAPTYIDWREKEGDLETEKEAATAVLTTYDGNDAVWLTSKRLIVFGTDLSVDLSDRRALMSTYIISDVPFSTHIPVIDILEKIKSFIP